MIKQHVSTTSEITHNELTNIINNLRIIFITCLMSILTFAHAQFSNLDSLLVNNKQYIVADSIKPHYQTVAELKFISLKEKKYDLNAVPIYFLTEALLDNKAYYDKIIDSLNTLVSALNNPEFQEKVGKKTKEEKNKLKQEAAEKKTELQALKNEISKYRLLKKESDDYKLLGINIDYDDALEFYGLTDYNDIGANDDYGQRIRIADHVIPIYKVTYRSKVDTLAVFSLKGGYYGFLLSDQDPQKKENKIKQKEIENKKALLLSLYTENPLYTETKDWTDDVFPDTAVYLQKHYYKISRIDNEEVNNNLFSTFYLFSNSANILTPEKYIQEKGIRISDVWENNLYCKKSLTYSHSEIQKLSLMDLWTANLFKKKFLVDTLYSVIYPRTLVKETIFEGEFNKRRFTNIKFEDFKDKILSSIDIDTVLVYADVYNGPYSFQLRSQSRNRGQRNMSQNIAIKVLNENAISINDKVYDQRLSDTNYVIGYQSHRDDKWLEYMSNPNDLEEFVEAWFNHLYDGAKDYYKEKLVEQEEEKKQLQKLYSKYGTKYVQAAEKFDIIVGMHEDLLPYPLKLWTITSRSRTSTGYTIYCRSMLDSSKRLTVTVSNKKVSYVAY